MSNDNGNKKTDLTKLWDDAHKLGALSAKSMTTLDVAITPTRAGETVIIRLGRQGATPLPPGTGQLS